jgi:hypothetical protein
VGAATGALGNAGVGDKLGAEVGFASSFSNALATDAINNHQAPGLGEVEWAAVDGGLGGAENAWETDISNNFSPTKDATVGNSVGVALSTYMGAGCGDIDHQDNANC